MTGIIYIVRGKWEIAVDTALMLAKVFGNIPDFWLNLQKRNDIWAALHNPKRRARIEEARPICEAVIKVPATGHLKYRSN